MRGIEWNKRALNLYQSLGFDIVQTTHYYRIFKNNGMELDIVHFDLNDYIKEKGAKKLYISAHSSEESQAFYRSIGCIQAKEINTKIAKNEPFDCQMEYSEGRCEYMGKFYGQKLPTIDEAKLLLQEAENLFPGPWVQHSLWTAKAAKLIAKNCEELNSEVAYILGMLHDIGRRDGLSNGITTIGHMLGGYNYSKKQGYDLLGKICLTHSCPSKSINDIEEVVNKTCSYEDYKFVEDFFNNVEYDDYDKLIQLCDALALPNGFTLVEKRLVDVALRHGVNEYIIPKWKAFIELKNYFEIKMGKSIYSILPGVIENTFEL